MSVSLCSVRKALELTQNLYPGSSTGEGHVMSECPGPQLIGPLEAIVEMSALKLKEVML